MYYTANINPLFWFRIHCNSCAMSSPSSLQITDSDSSTVYPTSASSPDGSPDSHSSSPSILSAEVSSMEFTPANNSDEFDSPTFDQCRLCLELKSMKHYSLYELYTANPQFADFYVPEKQICKCPPQKYHVMCLGRWARMTADRPCPSCRTMFESVHIVRSDSFWPIFREVYLKSWLMFALFLNLWLIKIKYFDLSWLPITDVVNNLPLTDYLLYLVPFFNIFILNYFYLMCDAQRYYFGLVEFHYSFGSMSSSQLFTSELVASNQLRKPNPSPWVSYGQVYNTCTICGLSLQEVPHLRYTCNCYAIHHQCLFEQITQSPNSTEDPLPATNLLCPNCGQLYQVPNKVKLFLLCARDTLLYRNSEVFDTFRYHCSGIIQHRPSFIDYLFFKDDGLFRLITFVSVVALFVLVESQLPVSNDIPCSWKKPPYCTRHWNQTTPHDSTYRKCQLVFHVLWFIYEFLQLTYRHYRTLILDKSKQWATQVRLLKCTSYRFR